MPTQEVMPAAMTITTARQRPRLGDAGFLRQARQRIVFAEDGDHRSPVPGLAHHRRRNPGDILCYPKSLPLQRSGMLRAGAELAITQFRHPPDPVGQLGERPLLGIDQRPDLFRILHAAHSLFAPGGERADRMIVHHARQLPEGIAL